MSLLLCVRACAVATIIQHTGTRRETRSGRVVVVAVISQMTQRDAVQLGVDVGGSPFVHDLRGGWSQIGVSL